MVIGSFLRKALFFISLSLMFFACSKKQESASIRIDFQSKNNQSLNSKIETLIINIHHPDGLVQYKQCENNCSSIEIETTTGPNKLIQVLAVVEGSVADDVNYGDVTINLGPGSNRIDISLEKKGSFASEGRVFGRYIPKNSAPMAGKFLTGTIDMKVFVGLNKPAIKIQETEIFGGFFDIFALDTLPFRYYFTGFDQQGKYYKNVPIFTDLHGSKGLDLSSPGLAASGQQIVHFNLNSPYYEENRQGIYTQRSSKSTIFGFYGKNPTGASLCSKAFSGTEVLDGSNGKGRLCKTATSTECTDYFHWADISKSHAAVSGASDSCSTTASQSFSVDLRRVSESHDSTAMGYSGPFVSDPDNGLVDILGFDSSTSQLSWKVANNVFLPSGVELFIHSQGSNFNYDDIMETQGDGILCEKLEDHGFISYKTFNSHSGSVSSTTIPSTLLSQGPVYVLCPRKGNGKYYRTAFVSHGDSGGSGPPSRIKITKVPTVDGFSAQSNQNVCFPLLLELVDGQNNSTHSQGAPFDVSVSSTGTSQSFFTNQEDCKDGTNMTSTFEVGGRLVIWMKSTAIENSFQLTAMETNGILAQGTFGLSSVTAKNLSYLKMVPDFYRNDALEIAKTEDCVPLNIVAMDIDNELTKFNNTSQVDFTNISDALSNPITFYEEAEECRVGTPNLGVYNLPDGVGLAQVFVNGADLSASIPDALSGSNESFQSAFISVVDPGSFDHYHVDVDGDDVAGSCRRFKIGAFDNHRPNSYPVFFPSNETLQLVDNSDVAGQFYNDQLDFNDPSGFPCDFDATTSTLATGPGDLGLNVNLQNQTYKKFYHLVDQYNVNTAFSVNFASGESIDITLSNNQPNAAFLSISEKPLYEFPQQSGSATPTHVFTVTNISMTNTTVGIVMANGASFFQTNTCGTLNAGDTCDVTVTFDDNGDGSHAGLLTITYDSGDRISNVRLKGERVP